MPDQIIAAGVKAHLAESLIYYGQDTIYMMNLVGGLTSLNAIAAAINMGRPIHLDTTGNPGAEEGRRMKMGFTRKGWKRIGPTIIDRNEYPGLYYMIIYHANAESKTNPEYRIQDDEHPVTMLTIVPEGEDPIDTWFAMLNERMHRTPLLAEWKEPLFRSDLMRNHILHIKNDTGAQVIRTRVEQMTLRGYIARLARRGEITAPRREIQINE